MTTKLRRDQKIRIGIDLHNLSTRPDGVVRTGIQQVVFNLLRAQFRLRERLSEGIDLVPLPTLPIVTEKTDFVDSMPNQVNNSYLVLKESANELSVPLEKLWNSSFSSEANWTIEEFFEVALTLDWIILTGLADFRTVVAKIKILNPEIRIAILVHDLIPYIVPELSAAGMPSWFERSYLDGFKYFADILVANSRNTGIDCENFLKGHVGRNVPIVSTIFPQEIPDFISANEELDVPLLAKFGLVPKRYFVCLGTIEPRKNLGLAVQGFLEFHKRFPGKSDFKLCMIGKPGWSDEDASIQKQIGSLADKFIFPGYLDRIAVEKIVHYSSGLTMPSRYEGFGMPITMAQVHGVGVVSTIISSLPEAAQLDAAFVEPNSVQEMMLAFYQLSLRSPKNKIVDLSLRDEVIAQWDELLRQMINQLVEYKTKTLPAVKPTTRRKKMVIEVHNLSILQNRIQKTGIQEVAHSILNATTKLRQQYRDELEIICLPFLPDLGYVMQFAATFNCDPHVLHEIEKQSGLAGIDFWGFDFARYGYSLGANDFAKIVENTDYFVVTTQFDVNRILSKLKEAAPHVSISAIVYDIIPTLYPNAVVPGLSGWFTHTLLRSFRANTSKAFGISRSAALDYLNNAEGEELDADVFALRLPINQSSVILPQNPEVLKTLGITEKRYFVVLGNNDPRKNVAGCISGFIRFCELFPSLSNEYSLLLVGPKGWITESVTHAMEKSKGRCHIVESGYLQDADMHTAVRHASAVLMPSHYEGFGLPLALALTYGVPTLTCVNSSLPEVTEASSFFVDPNNTTEIALGLKLVTQSKPLKKIEGDDWVQYMKDLIELHIH